MYIYLFTVIVIIIIVIIWYCKRSQKYHVSTNVRSDTTPKITNMSAEAVELDTNPSYGTIMISKEPQQTTVDTSPAYEGVNINAISPLSKREDRVNPLYVHSSTKNTNQSPEGKKLETNPSYKTHKKEAQPTTAGYPPMDEVHLVPNPSYAPFMKTEDDVNPLHKQSGTQDKQNSGAAYDYILPS